MSIALQLAEFALFVLACLLAIPALVFCIEICAAAFTRRRIAPTYVEIARPRLAVLMPAHDESTGIAASIASIVPQLHTGDRLLVVADNCSDDTAAVAKAAGADVIERQDALRRGKGYALDFGVRALGAEPPQIVIVVDADCLVAAQSLDRLAAACAHARRPVQALYLMRTTSAASLKMRIAEFAWVVKNHVRPLGLLYLCLPCQLMGTGMALPWECLRTVTLASGHLVEDMQLGIDLALAGAPPLFCPEARVTSVFPDHAAGAAAQRTRWEHGHLSVIANEGPRLLWRALTQRRIALLALTLDLCVPPLASLVLLAGSVAVLAAAMLLVGGTVLPLIIALGALALVAAAVLVAWRGYGRGIVSFGELLAAPLYVMSKLSIYLRLLTKRQVDWVRTKRGPGPTDRR